MQRVNLGAGRELEVERSVRERLYGGRPSLRVVSRGRSPIGRLVGGRYRLRERVGVGGMGVVYRAFDQRLKREVAVKVVAEHLAAGGVFAQRLRTEAELSARLAHPNIVAVLDAGAEPQAYIVMELVTGLDAETLLRRRGRLTPAHAVGIVAQVCDALEYAHGAGVVHRDVSARNILLTRGGTAKLADFGLASTPLAAPATDGASATGTPGYVAPEVLAGDLPSPRADLYSLAAVAYRLLAGPFAARAAEPLQTEPLPGAAPPLPPLSEARPGLPRALSDAVQRALSQDPDSRQASVAEFRADLAHLWGPSFMRAPVPRA